MSNIPPLRVEHILEKGSGAANEDYLIMDNGIYGVFDGATSLDGTVFEGGQSGGSLAASIAGGVFLQNHKPLSVLGVEANGCIRSQMERCKVDVSRRSCLWSASAAVVRMREDGIEWFQTGDAQVVFIDNDGGFRLAVTRKDHDYPTLNKIRELGRSHPEVHELIRTVRRGMNREYGVLNGEPEAVDFFRTGVEPCADVRTVLLFTDGLDLPCQEPCQYKDFSPLVDKVRELGLSGLRDFVRAQEAEDPDIEHYPRFKTHDDIAAIAIHL